MGAPTIDCTDVIKKILADKDQARKERERQEELRNQQLRDYTVAIINPAFQAFHDGLIENGIVSQLDLSHHRPSIVIAGRLGISAHLNSLTNLTLSWNQGMGSHEVDVYGYCRDPSYSTNSAVGAVMARRRDVQYIVSDDLVREIAEIYRVFVFSDIRIEASAPEEVLTQPEQAPSTTMWDKLVES